MQGHFNLFTAGCVFFLTEAHFVSALNLHAQSYAEQELCSMQKPFSAAEVFFHFRKNMSEKFAVLPLAVKCPLEMKQELREQKPK